MAVAQKKYKPPKSTTCTQNLSAVLSSEYTLFVVKELKPARHCNDTFLSRNEPASDTVHFSIWFSK